jgi:peptidoglycan/LPS O-acetylase OafA/YrhL
LQVLLVITIDAYLAPGLLSTARPRISRPDELTFSQWLGNLTLTESWRFHAAPTLGDAHRRYFLGQSWTLCYEEQFYVVLGIMLACCGTRGIFVGASLLSVACIGLRHFAPQSAAALNGFFIDTRWLMFAAGIAVYHARNYASPAVAAGLVVVLLTGILYAVACGEQHLFFAGGFALLLAVASVLPPLQWPRLAAPLRWCGTVCYSLYLVHVPIVRGLSHAVFDAGWTSADATVFIVCPLAVGAAIAAAWPFHVLIERRFMNRVRR